jgi:hypothetical protein
VDGAQPRAGRARGRESVAQAPGDVGDSGSAIEGENLEPASLRCGQRAQDNLPVLRVLGEVGRGLRGDQRDPPLVLLGELQPVRQGDRSPTDFPGRTCVRDGDDDGISQCALTSTA